MPHMRCMFRWHDTCGGYLCDERPESTHERDGLVYLLVWGGVADPFRLAVHLPSPLPYTKSSLDITPPGP
jgi:hypothetical protein